MLPVETDRLRLRRLTQQDAPSLAAYRSEPSVARYQSWSGMTLQEACLFIEEQERTPLGRHDLWFQLAIAEKATDELVGDVGICVKAPGLAAEIGFSVAPSFQGRGYALEACGAAIDLVFRMSAAATIEAVVDARNTPAIALVHRLGMSLERTENALFKGKMCSEHHFVLGRDARTGRAQTSSGV